MTFHNEFTLRRKQKVSDGYFDRRYHPSIRWGEQNSNLLNFQSTIIFVSFHFVHLNVYKWYFQAFDVRTFRTDFLVYFWLRILRLPTPNIKLLNLMSSNCKTPLLSNYMVNWILLCLPLRNILLEFIIQSTLRLPNTSVTSASFSSNVPYATIKGECLTAHAETLILIFI